MHPDHTNYCLCGCGQPIPPLNKKGEPRRYAHGHNGRERVPVVPKRPLEDRFWEKVQKADGCWVWTGTRHPSGHGNIGLGGRAARNIGAHRVSWMLHYGPIPAGLCVCHTCDNPPCVRPDHLFLGTRADNNDDMRTKGRNVPIPVRRGEVHPRAKLTDTQVAEIRERHLAGDTTLKEIGAQYGVSVQVIWYAVRRRA